MPNILDLQEWIRIRKGFYWFRLPNNQQYQIIILNHYYLDQVNENTESALFFSEPSYRFRNAFAVREDQIKTLGPIVIGSLSYCLRTAQKDYLMRFIT